MQVLQLAYVQPRILLFFNYEEFSFVHFAYMQVLQLAYVQPRTLIFSDKEYFDLQCGILAQHHFVEIILFRALAVITLPVDAHFAGIYPRSLSYIVSYNLHVL
jgi:hypothetical protein